MLSSLLLFSCARGAIELGPTADPAPSALWPEALLQLSADPFASARFAVSDLLAPHPGVMASTYELDGLGVPEGGIREEIGGIAVISAPFEWAVDGVTLGGGVLDGLRDGERSYLEPTLSANDLTTYAEVEQRYRDHQLRCAAVPGEPCFDDAGHRHDRLIRIARIEPGTVSAWIATSDFTTGAAHSNNVLACATWSRSTGERLLLSAILGQDELDQRLAKIDRVLHYAELGESDEPLYQLGLSNFTGESWPKGDTDNFLLDSQGDPMLCLPDPTGPGNGTKVLRLSDVDAKR